MKLTQILFALCTAAAVSFSAGARADQLAQIQQSHQLRVAVPQDFPPFGSVSTDMQPVGYDIDVAKRIAQGLGVTVVLVPVSSANRVPYLTTNKVDLIISSLGKNAEREKVIDFSTAYAPFFNGVFGPADMKVTGPADLANKTIGVTKGSIEDIELTKIAPTTATIKRYEDNNSTIQAFLSGQTPLIATGNVVAAAILARNPPQKPESKFLIKDSPCFIGIGKGETALQEKVNAIIAASRKDGTLDAISQHWLGTKLPASL